MSNEYTVLPFFVYEYGRGFLLYFYTYRCVTLLTLSLSLMCINESIALATVAVPPDANGAVKVYRFDMWAFIRFIYSVM